MKIRNSQFINEFPIFFIGAYELRYVVDCFPMISQKLLILPVKFAAGRGYTGLRARTERGIDLLLDSGLHVEDPFGHTHLLGVFLVRPLYGHGFLTGQ